MIRKKYLVLTGIALTSAFTFFAFSSAISRAEQARDIDVSNMMIQTDTNTSKSQIITDYALIPFTRLIGMADLIVTGSIEAVGNSAFNFHVEESLLHYHASKSIRINKYIPAEIFAPRTTPYAKMQRFVLFLMKPEQENAEQPWNILGYAGEGEMPVADEFVYFNAYDLKGLKHEPREVHGITRNLQRYKLEDFKDAVKNYRTCFSWKRVEFIKNNKKRSRWVPAKTCPDESVNNYQAKSWLHEYLVQETIKRIPVINP